MGEATSGGGPIGALAAIEAIGHVVPDNEITNDDLARSNPEWDMGKVAERAGVIARRNVVPGETAFDLSVRACAALVESSGRALDGIDAIVYCTHAPDYVIPGNAHLLHRHLDLGDEVMAFDYTLTCSGYVYGLAFAEAFVRAGMASDVLLVNAETMTQRVNPRDRPLKTLIGDGAAATRIRTANGGGRIVASKLCSRGRSFEGIYVPGGGARYPSNEETRREETDREGNVRSFDDMRMNGRAVWSFVTSTIPGHVEAFLSEHGLSIDDIDLCVFHQASKLVLDSLAEAIGIDESRFYVHMAETGNMASASIPVALKAAIDEGAVAAGDRVLLTAYGGGFSYGSVLLEF